MLDAKPIGCFLLALIMGLGEAAAGNPPPVGQATMRRLRLAP